ncbi:retron St85 family RNA-directed DNA polymerase [Rhodobacteraceae bacterium M382]|nr:retron St85 family RNA-directed DNA polymerase [Rhodobacteraceae bacterium M382]
MKPTATELLRASFRFSGDELDRFIATCPFRYKVYQIPKKNNRGSRTIAHPSRVLKAVQRTLLSGILNDLLVVHDSAKAYRKGTSIKDNASPHLDNSFLLKMDFSDFFPSIKSSDFEILLREKHKISNPHDINIFKKVFFMKKGEQLVLSIGSPGSPLISNSMMFDFDRKLSEISQSCGVNYTRYSDDLSFSTSTPDILFEWPSLVRKVLTELPYPKLSINVDKTIHSSRKHNRHVTGVTLSSEGKLSLGREKKRKIRAQVHQAAKLKPIELTRLRGSLAFLADIEPESYSKLRARYQDEFALIGSDIIKS